MLFGSYFCSDDADMTLYYSTAILQLHTTVLKIYKTKAVVGFVCLGLRGEEGRCFLLVVGFLSVCVYVCVCGFLFGLILILVLPPNFQ